METIEPPKQPVSERTLAIMQGLEHLQDVTKELREIRRLLEEERKTKDTRWTALKRAVNQFFSQI